MRPVTFEEVADPSEPFHLPLRDVPPPTQVVFGFCCRIATTPDILQPDDALPWVSVELRVDKSLHCHLNAGIIPGVLRFFQRVLPCHDPGPERGTADASLAAHVELPGAHITPLVDLLEGGQSGVVFVFLAIGGCPNDCAGECLGGCSTGEYGSAGARDASHIITHIILRPRAITRISSPIMNHTNQIISAQTLRPRGRSCCPPPPIVRRAYSSPPSHSTPSGHHRGHTLLFLREGSDGGSRRRGASVSLRQEDTRRERSTGGHSTGHAAHECTRQPQASGPFKAFSAC
jgi:hypothetical protein